ncbi:WG repeat-containing protein, partial [Paenibacillus oenotherae]
MFPIHENGVWGYIDQKGNVVVSPQFDYAFYGSEGLYRVKKNGKQGYISLENDNIPIKYDVVGEFHEGYCPIKIDNLWGAINKRDEVIIPSVYKRVWHFSEGWVKAETIEDVIQFLDTEGGVQLQYTDVSVGHFSHGLAFFTDKKTKRNGYINKEGELVISSTLFSSGCKFAEGLAPARYYSTRKWCFINPSGDIVIEPIYESVGFFSEGLCTFKRNEKTGYINKTGDVVIPPLFDFASDFYEGTAYVVVGERYGIINK